MSEHRSAEGRVRHVCALAFERLAERLDEEPRAAAPPTPAADGQGDAFSFQYDADSPPTVPPGERLDEWRHARAQPRKPRRRASILLRRIARRLDGNVISRRSFG